MGRTNAFICPECGKRNPPVSYACRHCAASFFPAPEPGEHVTRWLMSLDGDDEADNTAESAPSAEPDTHWLIDLTDTPNPAETSAQSSTSKPDSWLDALSQITLSLDSAETPSPRSSDTNWIDNLATPASAAQPPQSDLFNWAFVLQPSQLPDATDDLPAAELPAGNALAPMKNNADPAEIQSRQAALLRQYSQQQTLPTTTVTPIRPTRTSPMRPLAAVGLLLATLLLLFAMLITVSPPVVLADGFSATLTATAQRFPLLNPTTYLLAAAVLMTFMLLLSGLSWHRKRTRQQT